jgi:hypothetical protein
MRKRRGMGSMVVWAGVAIAGILMGKRLVPEARRYLRLRRM